MHIIFSSRSPYVTLSVCLFAKLKFTLHVCDITSERNVQGTDMSRERNVQGTDITYVRNVQGQTLHVRGMYRV